MRSPSKTSIKPVYWNGTHLSVFEFRVEKELGYDLDAAGASVGNAKSIIRWLSSSFFLGWVLWLPR
jgi:hypothetical protein